jgi:L-glyceraldehyde 3-phosphate reductase
VYETVGALASAVQQGRALYVGVSNYPTERGQEVAELLRQAGVPLLVHQPRYSIFDRSPEITGLLKLAAEDGFGLVAYSPLAQGLLTDMYLDGTIPAGARAANSSFLSPEIGASSTAQLDHNLAALDFPPLTEEELALIDEHGIHGTGQRT